MKKRIVFFALLIQLILTYSVFAESSQITNGLNYLSSAQSADGSWTSSEEQIITTAEAIETLKLLNQAGTANYTNALSWLQNQSLETTNHLAERIYVLAAGGNDGALLVSYLDELVRAWGGYEDYIVNNMDTAFALQALKKINYSDQAVIQSAISYLLAHQNSDGGWGFDNGDASNIYMTAIVSRTLQQLSLTSVIATAINKATAFIVARQNADGSFGASVYETALAYIALAAVTTDNTVLGKAAQYIINTQAADGSWNEDPYLTALALQALYYSANKPLPPSPTLATIIGTVIDASTNQVLKGVLVVLQSNTAINATSDSSGVFTLNNIPSGSQTVSVSLVGYTTSTITVNVTEGSVISLGDIPLSVNATTGIIKGTVTDASNGQPLAGVSITVSGSYSGTTTTGADGNFIFTGVTPGGITIAASFAGYYTSTGSGSVAAGGIVFFNPQQSTTPPSGTDGKLIGKVVSGTTGNPIEGAVVSADSATAVSTDAQGVFSIDGIAAGTHQIKVIASGYGSLNFSIIVSEGGTTDMGIIIMSSSASGTTTITGKVTDSTNGQPIALADVSVAGTSCTTKTAIDGSYSISGIGQLEFSVRASASGYNSKVVKITTSEYGPYNADLILDPAQVSNVKINSLATDKTSYGASTTVNIPVTLENTGDVPYDVVLVGDIIDKHNNVIAFAQMQNNTTLNLPAHSIVNSALVWNTAKYVPADYSIMLKVNDIVAGLLLAQGSTTFTINPDVLIGDVMPLVKPQFTNVKKAESVTIRAQIVNWSNIDANFSADCTVKDTTGVVVFSNSNNFTIPAAELLYEFNAGSFDYTFTKSGEYAVEITIMSNGTAIARGVNNISVAPSIRIEPSIKLTPDIVTPDGDKTIRLDIELRGVEEMP